MDFKQYPMFSATVGLLGLACVAGVGFGAWQSYNLSKGKSALGRAESRLRALKNSETAPTEENVRSAQKNLQAMDSAAEAIFRLLEGAPEKSLYVDFRSSGGELNSQLRGTSDRLTGALQQAGIRIAGANFGFGFTRYLEKGEVANGEFSAIATENRVIEKLVEMLIAAKIGEETVILQSIQREPVEIADAGNSRRRGRAQQDGGDEYRPLPGESLRKNGVVETFFFRIKFVAPTEVTRRFLNAVGQSGYPIAIREVTVAPADASMLASPDAGATSVMGIPDGAGDGGQFPNFAMPGVPEPEAVAPAAENPAATAHVVLKRAPSIFTISLEYIIPQKPSRAKVNGAESTVE